MEKGTKTAPNNQTGPEMETVPLTTMTVIYN